MTANRRPMVICYRVAIDLHEVNGKHKGELIQWLPPLKLAEHSHYVARMLAISYVQAHPFVYLGGCLHRLVVQMVDYYMDKEYLIYNNRKPTKRMLENLELEFQTYVWNGYSFYGWELMTDRNGNAYRVISTEDWWVDCDQCSIAK